MKNLSFFSLLFMAGMLLFVSGCQRDEDHWVSNEKVAHITKHYLFKKTVDLDTMYDMKRHLQKFLKKSGGRNMGWDESNVLLNNAEYIQINDSSSTTTIEISHQVPNKIYNLVINKVGETFLDPFVVEYHLHTDFVVGYANGNLTMQNFKGVLSTYPIEDFFGNSGRSSFDCQKAKACMDLYLNYLEGQQGNGDGTGGSTDGGYTQGGDGGSGGNGSGEGEGEGEGTGTGNNGSGWNGTGWITGEGTTGSGGTSGSGSGGDPGPGSNGGGTGDDGSTECEEGEEPVEIESITRTLCILDPSNQTFKGNDPSGSRNDELKKCSKMLNVLGFVNNTGIVADPEKTCIENCRQEYPEVAEAIEALDDLEILNPCTGDNIALDKSDIESELCMTGNYNLESLDKLIDKKLEAIDKIIPDLATLSANCPNFKCVYDYLLNSGNKLFCDKLYLNFEYDDKITVKISGFNQPGGAEGITTYSDGGKTINIAINKITCDHPLSIASTLIHESIHAALFKEAKLKDPSITREDIIRTLRLNAKTTDFDHEVMAIKYVNLLAESLREADGNRYPVEYYMYLAWSGIQNAGYELGYLKDPWIGQFKDKHDFLMAQESSFCK